MITLSSQTLEYIALYTYHLCIYDHSKHTRILGFDPQADTEVDYQDALLIRLPHTRVDIHKHPLYIYYI